MYKQIRLQKHSCLDVGKRSYFPFHCPLLFLHLSLQIMAPICLKNNANPLTCSVKHSFLTRRNVKGGQFPIGTARSPSLMKTTMRTAVTRHFHSRSLLMSLQLLLKVKTNPFGKFFSLSFTLDDSCLPNSSVSFQANDTPSVRISLKIGIFLMDLNAKLMNGTDDSCSNTSHYRAVSSVFSL